MSGYSQAYKTEVTYVTLSFFLLGLCLIGGLWNPDTSDIINGESKLIETVGFIFLKSCNFKVEAIVLTIIKI